MKSNARRRRKESSVVLPTVASVVVILVAVLLLARFMNFTLPEVVIGDARLSDTPVVYYFNDDMRDAKSSSKYKFGADQYRAYLNEQSFLKDFKIGDLNGREILSLGYDEFLALAESHPEEFSTWVAKAEEVYGGNMVDNYDYFIRAKASSAHEEAKPWAKNSVLDRITPVYATESNPNPRGADPALAAAILVDAYFNFGQEEFVPEDIRALKSGEMPDALHLRFLEDPELWEELVSKYTKYIENAELSVIELGDYQSAMYMRPDGLQGDKPSVEATSSNGQSGHSLEIKTKDGQQGLRFECGWQPIRVTYWEKPSGGVTVTNPKPTPTPTPAPTPTPVSPKTGQEPTPEGSGYEGKPDNAGNPPEASRPSLPAGTKPVNPDTPPGGSDEEGMAIAPGANDDTGGRTVPSAPAGANPEPDDSGSSGSSSNGSSSTTTQDPPANDGSAGNPNDIP